MGCARKSHLPIPALPVSAVYPTQPQAEVVLLALLPMKKAIQELSHRRELVEKHSFQLHRVSDTRFLSIGLLSALLFFMGERTDSLWIAFIFKPIPIYVMIAWVLWNAKTTSLYRRLIIIGLFFGSLGM